ncbi:hypothetical protein [Streptodolium elevatio]|uniref:Minor tail protein n=1 Tax=Streptodolium elevatio TaxID=3157996 RepID=A0ABV3DLE2_9ACTN
MGIYRVEFADLLTDTTLYRTEVDGLRFGRRIADSEVISGSVTVTERNAAQLRELLAKKTAVYVYEGKDLQVGGIVWDPTAAWDEHSAEQWQFSAATFESYLNQVVISEDIPPADDVDQLDIARVLVQHMQSDPSAHIGIQLDPLVSGVLRDRTQYLASANLSYGEALTNLGNVQGGFEWTIDVWIDPSSGERIKYMRFGYPRLGSASAVHVIERSSIKSWREKTVQFGTRYRARGGTPQGAGTGEQQPIMSDVYAATGLLDGGWPRIDVVTDYSTVTSIDTLNSHAERDLANALAATAIPEISVNLEQVRITPQAIGETVRVRNRTLLRGATDLQYRLAGIVVTAGQRGTAGSATLTLEAL